MELDQPAPAEPILAINERILKLRCPEHWTRWNASQALAECRGRQGRFDEAEPLLRESVARVLADRATPTPDRRRALVRTAGFYAAWNRAEPNTAREIEAAEWHRRLAEHDAEHGVPDGTRR
jgi:hypothetical protein